MRLLDEHGSAVELGRVLDRGGEAEIWSVPSHPESVAKIYFAPAAAHEKKLRHMVAQPPLDPMRSRGHISICWPTAMLYEPGTARHRGFLMPRMDRAQYREMYRMYVPKNRMSEAPDFTWAYLVAAAENISSVIDSIHGRGYVVGDMNESNFFISGGALATVIDCDSMQVTTPNEVYRCTVGKPEYTAPELRGLDFSTCIRTEAQDRFALAVLIFHLVMEGFHPYAGKWNKTGESPSIEERISQGASPYVGSARIQPSPAAPPFAILPKPVQELFLRAFYSGNLDPAKRPSAKEWQVALHSLGQSLETCRVNPQHRYSKHLKRCPWCERKALLGGFDPFPLPGLQTSLPQRPFRQQTAPGPAVATPGQLAARVVAAAFAPATAGQFTPAAANRITATRSSAKAALRWQLQGVGLRTALFLVPFLSAAMAMLLPTALGWRSGLFIEMLWGLMAGLGAVRRFQRTGVKNSALFLIVCGVLYKAAELVPGALPALASSLMVVEAGVLTLLAARSLLTLLRPRIDWYRLHGRNRLVVGLAALPLSVPLLAAGMMSAIPAANSAVAAAFWRKASAAGPLSSSGTVEAELLTCAPSAARCGCQTKSAFRRGETVSLIVLSRSTPRITLQVEPVDANPVLLSSFHWASVGPQFCAGSRYRIPQNAATGFTHVHLSGVATSGAAFRVETGYSVVP